MNVRQWSPDQLEAGGNFYRTFIHETGHGLGLKHPHDSGSGAFNPNYFPGIDPTDDSAVRQRSLGVLELNHMFGSVMSYLHGYEFDAEGHIDVLATRQRPVADDFFLDHGFAATPMAYDIAAIQYMYGANLAFRTADNVYVLPDSNDSHPFIRGPVNEVGEQETIIYQPDKAYRECLWDAGGIDEIRYDVTDAGGNVVAGKANAIINLTAATLDMSETGYGVLSYAAFIGGGYTIANGVVIENATGGDGSDLLTGNSANNVIQGRGGNDQINATLGTDIVVGGDGTDVVVFSGTLSSYVASNQGQLLSVTSGTNVTYSYGVESLRFADGIVSATSLSGLVDNLFYLSQQSDVFAAGMDAEVHYDTHGRLEGRDPNAFFDTSAYLARYGDVAASGMNPVDHYMVFGWREGRDPSANFDNDAYLAANSDVAAENVDPLLHFLTYGRAEGRVAVDDGVIG